MNTYTLNISAKCPHDPKTRDVYQCEITSNETLLVEAILETARDLGEEPIYQEDLTRALAERLNATVTLEGDHSNVHVVSSAMPK